MNALRAEYPQHAAINPQQIIGKLMSIHLNRRVTKENINGVYGQNILWYSFSLVIPSRNELEFPYDMFSLDGLSPMVAFMTLMAVLLPPGKVSWYVHLS